MIAIEDYLNGKKEATPEWLKKYQSGDNLSFKEMMSSGRNLYYPGSGYDGQPIKTFNKAHFAHKFFYVDYGINKEQMVDELSKDNALKGYKIIGVIEYQEQDLTPNGWKPHYEPTEEEMRDMEVFSGEFKNPYCLVFIFERTEEYSFEHGADRIAVVCIKGDGIATYDALFANYNRKPDILVLQDHGFGGNYNCFGRGGALEQIAVTTNCFPEFILCADNTNIWQNYTKVENTSHVGKTHMRWLFRRDNYCSHFCTKS